MLLSKNVILLHKYKLATILLHNSVQFVTSDSPGLNCAMFTFSVVKMDRLFRIFVLLLFFNLLFFSATLWNL